LPLVLLVLFFQRKIVQGLTAGAVKGWGVRDSSFTTNH
jgi:hypothetical protein